MSPSLPPFTGSKLCLYIYCRALSQYNTADILATDHRNDLFVNGFGLAASLLSRYCWWLDPAGAILVSLIILRSWVWTAYGKPRCVVGTSCTFIVFLTIVSNCVMFATLLSCFRTNPADCGQDCRPRVLEEVDLHCIDPSPQDLAGGYVHCLPCRQQLVRGGGCGHGARDTVDREPRYQ